MAKEQIQAELVEDGVRSGGGGRRFRTPEEREAVVRRFERSGLTQREFAKREGLKLPTLAYWLACTRHSARPAAVQFQEVALPTSPMPEAVLPCGVVLRAPTPESLALLVRLVRS